MLYVGMGWMVIVGHRYSKSSSNNINIGKITLQKAFLQINGITTKSCFWEGGNL